MFLVNILVSLCINFAKKMSAFSKRLKDVVTQNFSGADEKGRLVPVIALS